MNRARRPRRRGYMLSEMVIVIAILGLMLSMVVVDIVKLIAKAKEQATLAAVTQSLAVARLQSIKRRQPVVVEFTIEPGTNRVVLRTFEDRNGDYTLGTYTPLGGGPVKTEEILNDFALDPTFRIWKHGATADDLDSGVLFAGYNGDPDLKHRVVFRPDGSIVGPGDAASGQPSASSGRGIYLADRPGSSFYRITFPTNLVARARVDKWAEDAGYTDTGWTW